MRIENFFSSAAKVRTGHLNEHLGIDNERCRILEVFDRGRDEGTLLELMKMGERKMSSVEVRGKDR